MKTRLLAIVPDIGAFLDNDAGYGILAQTWRVESEILKNQLNEKDETCTYLHCSVFGF